MTIKVHDEWADIDNGNKTKIKDHLSICGFIPGFYEKVTDMKRRDKKVLLALGGWNDSESDKYSRLVGSKEARSAFTMQVVNFLSSHNFDGLDIDWEYPKCWQVDCSLGPEEDKQGFANLIKELFTAFQSEGLLLSAAVSPSKTVIEEAYDVGVMDAYLDYVSVMAYDYHGHWDNITGHVAPMYHHGDTEKNNAFNMVRNSLFFPSNL